MLIPMRTGNQLQARTPVEPSRRLAAGTVRPAFLHLVTVEEMRDLSCALMRGTLPADLELKLHQLDGRTFMHQYLAQHCRAIARLLSAVFSGEYRIGNTRTCEELLRVLAYVRKDDDAIPDYTSGGFSDDLKEVRTALEHFQPVLEQFKSWHLCHQVPHLWRT